MCGKPLTKSKIALEKTPAKVRVTQLSITLGPGLAVGSATEEKYFPSELNLQNRLFDT